MHERFWNMPDVEPGEQGPGSLLLIISFFMVLLMATFVVAYQSFFPEHLDEQFQLPNALVYSGLLGIGNTFIYNQLQGRVSFMSLAIFNLIRVIGFTPFIEFGDSYISDVENLNNLHKQYRHGI